jgi:Cu/Zn superoxide dismutase
MYPIHIHTGSDCSSPMGHWDPPRGELPTMGTMMATVMCAGNLGTLMYTRKFSDMKPWQIGDMSMADVLGHTLVIHDPDSTATPPTPIACGKIVKQ